MWAGWFVFGPVPALPGNCYAQAGPIGAQHEEVLLYTNEGRLFAQYVAAENVGQLITDEIAKARRRHPELPVLAYWTRADHTGPVPPADWVGVELYRGATESVADFEARGRRAIARCPKAMLIPQCYTSNTDNTDDLASIPPVVARLASAPNVVGVLAFSGAGRATGYQDHPEVQGLWTALYACVSAPALPPPAPAKPEPTGEGDLMLISKFVDPMKGLLVVKTAKPVAGHAGIFTLILPDDRVYSMQPDGTDGDRDPGTDGPFERCRVSGNIATFLSHGNYNTRAFVLVEGL